MSEGSCCPPNSEGYLAPNYAVTGSIVELQNDCQAYVTNNLSSHQGKGIVSFCLLNCYYNYKFLRYR